MALLVMALFSVVVLAGFTTVATMARTAGADYQALRNSYALESAGEGVMAQVATAVVDGRLTPEELHVDAGRGLNGTSVSAQVETAEAPEMRPVATGPSAGRFALHQYCKIKVEARDSAAYRARAEIGVETQTIPAFQFALFYEKDLELHPGVPMSLAGRVHTNANLYVNHSITFDGLITAAESTFLAVKAGPAGGTVSIRNAANVPVLLDFDSRSLGRRAFRGRSEQLFNGRLMSAAHGVKPLRLGVLKAGTVAFTPPLPAAKQKAIQRLGMGVLNKLYLRFPRRFWDADAELINYIPAQHGRWAESLNMAYYTDAPVLLCFNAGIYGTATEALSDAEVVAAAMTSLRTIYGADIPAPTAHLRTRWAADPYARGSYSFAAVGSSPADRDALAAPVGGRLFFAGEATYRDYPSTVHGAYLSGRRAAANILARLTAARAR